MKRANEKINNIRRLIVLSTHFSIPFQIGKCEYIFFHFLIHFKIENWSEYCSQFFILACQSIKRQSFFFVFLNSKNIKKIVNKSHELLLLILDSWLIYTFYIKFCIYVGLRCFAQIILDYSLVNSEYLKKTQLRVEISFTNKFLNQNLVS